MTGQSELHVPLRQKLEGLIRGVETRVRMKRGSGMKGLVDKSRGIVRLITAVFANINPRELLRLPRHDT